jgi:hypothetical protein
MWVVVARPAGERDRRGRALRQTGDIAARIADHARRDLVVEREVAREEDRSVAVALERRLPEVEDDDATLVPLRSRAALLGEDPRLRRVLVDRGRPPQALHGARLPLRSLPVVRRLRRVPWLRGVMRLRLAWDLAKRQQPVVWMRRETRDEARRYVNVAGAGSLDLRRMGLARLGSCQGATGAESD